MDSSKLKVFADDSFEFHEHGGKFSKWVVNNLAKGEIAHSEQFLLFHQCFQKTCTADTLKQGVVRERLSNEVNWS